MRCKAWARMQMKPCIRMPDNKSPDSWQLLIFPLSALLSSVLSAQVTRTHTGHESGSRIENRVNGLVNVKRWPDQLEAPILKCGRYVLFQQKKKATLTKTIHGDTHFAGSWFRPGVAQHSWARSKNTREEKTSAAIQHHQQQAASGLCLSFATREQYQARGGEGRRRSGSSS